MVDLPPDLVIDSTLEIGSIYKIKAPELISTDIPHFFIVVAIDNHDIYLVLCTSKKDKKVEHFENKNLDFTSLVYIKPDIDNKLPIDTYINCNDYFVITKNNLKLKLISGYLTYIGKVSLNHYLQIKNGIVESYTNDIPKYLLKHPNE